MDIRVRELVAFIKANPLLEEYDAPLSLVVPAEDKNGDPHTFLIDRLKLSRDGGGATLELALETQSEFCAEKCTENKLAIEKAKSSVARLIDTQKREAPTGSVLTALESIYAVLDGEGE